MIAASRRFVIGLALAGTMLPILGARAEDASAVQAPIQALYTALEQLMKQGQGTPFPQRFEALAPVIDRDYDLDTVLRVSVGARWATLDDAAKKALFTAFRSFTIATYVANFDSYDGERFEILPNLRASGSDEIVASRIVPAKGDPVRIDYVMHQNNGWRIVDVLLEGTISRVAVQRSDFRNLLASGDAEALIASLQRKTADLSGGTIRS
ncbi:MAG: ABC transporter substrate-binding protein [Rhodospirillales bacterium]|nr:ABC transporter substrate-binding protein [Rhodospirillales bacterium]